MPSTFVLGEKYEEFLEELVKSGDYGSKTEAVRDALRLLQRDRIRWSEILEAHRAALADPAPLVSRDEAFARLRSRFTTLGKPAPDETSKADRPSRRKS